LLRQALLVSIPPIFVIKLQVLSLENLQVTSFDSQVFDHRFTVLDGTLVQLMRENAPVTVAPNGTLWCYKLQRRWANGACCVCPVGLRSCWLENPSYTSK
jgi:hypothetical protein